MNSKDLRAIEHVQRLVEIGVDSLKIEGRTKSAYYVARTAQVYRRTIDDAVAGRPFDPALLGELEVWPTAAIPTVSSSGITNTRCRTPARHSESGRSLYVGDVVGWDATRGLAEIDVKNRFAVGDRIEVIHPSGNFELALTRLENADGAQLSVAPGNGHRVWIPLAEVLQGAIWRALFERATMPHLFVDISSHGFGHLAQTAPISQRTVASLPWLETHRAQRASGREAAHAPCIAISPICRP